MINAARRVKGFKSQYGQLISSNNTKYLEIGSLSNKEIYEGTNIYHPLDNNNKLMNGYMARVIPYINLNTDEIYATMRASILGICPKFIDFIECDVDNVHTYILLFEYINGLSLNSYLQQKNIKSFSQVPNNIIERIRIIYTTLYNNGIKIDNKNGDNIIIINKRFYLVNYSNASIYRHPVTHNKKFSIKLELDKD